ncbi:polysaccharide biosynthesis tyrosine autokinase [Nocardioides sp. BGMRC 2183]|nr:polysaccharide biosynthesis tyrosine autokinase [Nocardioides sp. BGMRC 2183]
MELRDYLRILRRRWISILVVAVAVTAAAGLFTALQTPQYASNARLFISTADTDESQLLQGSQFSAQRVKSYADLINSRELANRVKEELELDIEAGDLAAKVKAEVAIDTVNLSITVTDTDPHEAQRIAQAYAESLVDLVRELETPSGDNAAPVKATIVDAASFPEDQVSPRPVRNIGVGLVFGLLVGVGIAVLRELLDTRVRSAEDIASITEAPVLGAIVNDSAAVRTPLITQLPAQSPRAESFRVLRTNLQFVDVDSPSKVFVVTSAVPAEGKTSTALNLAISVAQGGARTVLVECDLRRPRAACRLEIDEAVGVTSVLVGKVSASEATQRFADVGLDVIASGPLPPNPAELIQSNAMSDLLTELRARYDVVVIDGPPLLPVTDAALLSSKADGAMLVICHGKATRDQVRGAVERLEQVDAHLVGVVLNRVPAKAGGYGYGYGYGYSPEGDAALRVDQV